MMYVYQTLKSLPLFHDLGDREITTLAAIGTEHEVTQGTVVFREGDKNARLYVVVEGAVRLYRAQGAGAGAGELELRVARTGDYFGELSLIDGAPRSASAVALEASTLFVIEREDFLDLLTRSQAILTGLLVHLSRSLRMSGQHLVGLANEKERLKSEGELERLRALSQMVAGVAHEINTPLGIIQNAASIVTESLSTGTIGELAKDEEARSTLTDLSEACQLIQKNGQHAARLIQNFKSLSVRQIADARETVDLLEVVKQGIDLYRYKARASGLEVQVISDVAESQRSWDGFPGNLSQVLLNLITNIDRYAYPTEQGEKKGGKAEVTVRQAMLPGDRPGFEIVVRDFGRGIPASDLPKIFTPFFTTGRDKDGTGLGLAIVHNIMTSALLGSVRVESTPGEGTAFFLQFPRSVPRGAS